MSDWRAQAARITLFPIIGGGHPVSALDLFRAVVGSDPDNFQNQTVPGMPIPQSAAQGRVSGMTFGCQVQPVRIDFTFSPAVSQPSVFGQIPAFEDSKTLHDEMEAMLPRIEQAVSARPFSRAACYFQLGVDSGTSVAANQILMKTIPYEIKLTDEEDFVLQINRPRPAKEDPSIGLNILTKWSAQRVRIMSFVAGAHLGNQPSLLEAPTVNTKTMATIALDNSSKPVQSSLTPQQIKIILADCFSEFAKQLMKFKIDMKGFSNASL